MGKDAPDHAPNIKISVLARDMGQNARLFECVVRGLGELVPLFHVVAAVKVATAAQPRVAGVRRGQRRVAGARAGLYAALGAPRTRSAGNRRKLDLDTPSMRQERDNHKQQRPPAPHHRRR